MANQGAKRRLEENKSRLKTLRLLLIVGIATFLLVRLVLYRNSVSMWHFVGFAVTLLAEWLTYTGIASFAAPVYENGELIDGGADLNMKGMCGYYHDLLYITVFVQVGAAFTNYMWYVYLVVPGYGLYKLAKGFIIPYFMAGKAPEPVLDEATRKRLEKAEKRAERRKMKSFR